MKKFLMILALGLIFAGSCQQEEVATNPISAGEIELSDYKPATVASDGGALIVSVTSNAAWRLTGKKTWCRPSVVEGESGAEVVFTVDPNETSEIRSEIYKFFTGNKTVIYVVEQQAADIFILESNPAISLGSNGGEFAIKMTTNVEYSYVINDDAKEWVSVPQTRAAGTERLIFRARANDTYKPRSGSLVIRANGQDYLIVVSQAQNNAFSVGQINYELEPGDSELTVRVLTNIAYTIEVPSTVAWIRHKSSTVSEAPGLTEHLEIFTIDPGQVLREGTIIFKPTNGFGSVTLKVKQKAAEVKTFEIADANLRNFLDMNQYIKVVSGSQCQLMQNGIDVMTLTYPSQNVKSTEGLDGLPNLVSFTCKKSPLTSIILGASKIKTFDGSSGKGAAVVVSSENLETLNLNYTLSMTSLDISQCPNLTTLTMTDCGNKKNVNLYMAEGQELTTFATTNTTYTIIRK